MDEPNREGSRRPRPMGLVFFEGRLPSRNWRSRLAGLKSSNLVNRGGRREGVQIELSRGLRNLLRTDVGAFQSVCLAIDSSLRDLAVFR
jgi:phage replication-related protein YjqB (UPF0714/DUF867 family)